MSAQLRAVSKQFKPLHTGAWFRTEPAVSRRSKKEVSYPRKAVLIAMRRDLTLSWTNLVGHTGNYVASIEDTPLAYRLAVSMLRYLSRRSIMAESRLKAKGRPV